MPSIFSKIATGEIPSYKVAEDDHYMAFLDISPLTEGHTLVIPKVETDYIFDIDDNQYTGLFLFAKRVAEAMVKVIPCERIGVAVIGLEVPHAHIHLVPLRSMDDIDFKRPKLKLEPEKLKEIAGKIAGAMPRQ